MIAECAAPGGLQNPCPDRGAFAASPGAETPGWTLVLRQSRSGLLMKPEYLETQTLPARRSFTLFSLGREDTLEGKAQVIFRGFVKDGPPTGGWKSLITPFCLEIYLPGSVLHSHLLG